MGRGILELFAVTVVAGVAACSGADSSTVTTAAGGNQGTGGTAMSGAAGVATGGASASSGVVTGGTSTSSGGTATGGAPSSGGAASGGTSTSSGGTASGGTSASSGGTSTSSGGTATGGAPSSGGAASGGTATGGAVTGGTRAASGGVATGGAATGGTRAASGGVATGGAATGGTSATTGGTTGACMVGPKLSGGTAHCANGLGSLGNGYNYEVWMNAGTNCGTFYGVGAAYRADWNLGTSTTGDFLARAGLNFGATKPHDQIGTISADYAFTKLASNGFSWVAIYGWTFSNLAEYYIVEDWSVNRPGVTYTLRGTLTVDGGTYDIYYNRRTGAVSPQGSNTDFDQFWSVRRVARQCGHVSISEHFKQWQSLGMDMTGLLRESMIVTEALRGSGTVDFASASVQVN